MPFKKHKFNVSPKEERTSNGIVFDSKWEMKVYDIFREEIPEEHLHLQPRFTLLEAFVDPSGKKQRAITYVSDFLLGDGPDITDRHILIDCKGMSTDVFKIKEKLFMSKYGHMIHKPKTNNTKAVKALIDMYRQAW